METVASSSFAPFRVRAVAMATAWSPAYGTVELACQPMGLELAFLSMSRVAKPYAPRPAASEQRVVVPYDRIRELARDGVALRVEVDPALTPWSRLTLVRFTTDRWDRLERAVAARRRIRATAWQASPHLAAASALGAWSLGGASPAEAVAVGAAVLAIVAVLGDVLARRLAFGRAAHLDVRDAFLADLASFGVAVGDGPAPFAAVPAEPPVVLEPFADVGRGVVGASMFALAAVVVLALGRAFVSARHESPSAAVVAVASASAPTASAAPPTPPIEGEGAPCTCPRGGAAALEGPPPRLAVRVSSRSDEPGGGGWDVVAVNDGSRPLHDVTVTATLLQSDAVAGARVIDRRPLFWGGTLAPADAVKWRVRGAADELRVETELSQPLDRADLAPADAFFALRSARARQAKLHAMSMLAFLGDARALELADALRREERPEEAAELARVARAMADVRACDARFDRRADGTAAVSACVNHGGDADWPRATLRLAGPAQAPARPIELPGPIVHGAGTRRGRVLAASDAAGLADEATIVGIEP